MQNLDFLHAHIEHLHVNPVSRIAIGGTPCVAQGTASITVLLPDNRVSRIHGVCTRLISTKCPLLGYAFEDGIDGSHACLEASSENAVVCLLRHLYTDNYLEQDEQPVPVASILVHAEVYKLARDFDIPELQVAAYCNFSRETELSCSMPTPLVDLCDTVRFVYKHLANEQSIADTLLHYCVSVFGYHRLGSNQEFRQAAFDNPDFHQALCETNCKRNFEDDGASDIVCMSACRSYDRPIAHFEMDHRAQSEFQFEEWYDPEAVNNQLEHKEDVLGAKRHRTGLEGAQALVHRSKDAYVDSSEGEELSDQEGFVLVRRTKPKPTVEEVCKVRDAQFSPEIVAVPSPESAKGSVYGSSGDEQWTSMDTPSGDEWALL